MHEYLSQYPYLINTIRALLLEKEEIMICATKMTSLSGGVRGTGDPHKIEKWIGKLSELDDKINDLINQASEQSAQIYDLVFSMPASLERNVIELKYLNGNNMTYEEIGQKLGYTSSTVEKAHRRGLQKLSVIMSNRA